MRQIYIFWVNKSTDYFLTWNYIVPRRHKKKKFKEQKNTDTQKNPQCIHHSSSNKTMTFPCLRLSRIRQKYSFKIDNQRQWRQMWDCSPAISRGLGMMMTSTLNCWLRTPFLSPKIIRHPPPYRLPASSNKVIHFTIQPATTIHQQIKSGSRVLGELPRRVTWSKVHPPRPCSSNN